MDTTVTDAQLQAAFLAARGEGKILDDNVLRAIILAAREVAPAGQQIRCKGCGHVWTVPEFKGTELCPECFEAARFCFAEPVTDLDAKRRAYRTPEWLRERVNDPYGTPSKHPFWSGPIGCLAVRTGVYAVFTHGGWAYAYDTKHNAWLHFATEAERAEHCSTPPIDPWA